MSAFTTSTGFSPKWQMVEVVIFIVVCEDYLDVVWVVRTLWKIVFCINFFGSEQ